MASDNRDWYRDWWRKRTGYTERASFRISHDHGEKLKNRSAWRRNLVIAAIVFFTIFLLKFLR